jgi:CheY-like chemotaxis protein
MPKPTILAVDDTPGNLVALEAVLDQDFTLLFARSGQEAIAVVRKHRNIDVILMDVQMPVMDGFEAAAQIKRLPGGDQIPIVFITAVYNEDPHVKRGYAAGGVDYFTKPFDPDLLRLKIGIYASFHQREAVLKERMRQLKETEDLLHAGRKLSLLLESLPVGILISDADGRICQANDEVARICKSLDVLKNDAYGRVIGWWDGGGHLLKDAGGPLSRALQGTASRNQVLEIRCVDGSAKPVLISASPLLGLDAEIVGAVIVIQDMSEHERFQAELQDRIARLVSLGVELEQSVRS